MYVVIYTRKRIAAVDIEFGEEYWYCTKEMLMGIYRLTLFSSYETFYFSWINPWKLKKHKTNYDKYIITVFISYVVNCSVK